MAHCRYRTLPHREEILRGVLGADLVGFHIYDYARHFHTACSRVLGTGGAEGVTEGNEGIFDHASRRSIAVDGA
jgi:trehalose 6-phosphate synthase/phosphatase